MRAGQGESGGTRCSMRVPNVHSFTLHNYNVHEAREAARGTESSSLSGRRWSAPLPAAPPSRPVHALKPRAPAACTHSNQCCRVHRSTDYTTYALVQGDNKRSFVQARRVARGREPLGRAHGSAAAHAPGTASRSREPASLLSSIARPPRRSTRACPTPAPCSSKKRRRCWRGWATPRMRSATRRRSGWLGGRGRGLRALSAGTGRGLPPNAALHRCGQPAAAPGSRPAPPHGPTAPRLARRTAPRCPRRA